MKELFEKLLNKATKNSFTIILSSVITSAILTSILVALYLVYYIFTIPTNSQLVIPAGTYPVTNDVYVEDTNLHKVGVYVIFPEDRGDLFEFMWKTKTFINNYFAYSFEDTDIDIKDLQFDDIVHSLEAEIEKYMTLELYLENTYGKERAEEIYSYLKVEEETIGNSDTLAISLLLKQIAENEVITSSEYKVAITGNMDEHGNVLSVGEVPAKAVTADLDDADYFIVPAEQEELALQSKQKNELAVEVIGVETIDEAYEFIQELE